jgi:hypothetical protein
MSDLVPWWAPWSGRALVAAAILAALAVAIWGLRRRRSATPRCGRCRYDLTGLAQLRCPECGWLARHADEAQRGPRRWRVVILALLAACALPVYVAAKRTKQYGWDYYLTFGPGHYFFGWQTVDEVRVGAARVSVLRDRSPLASERMLKIRFGGGRPDQVIREWRWELGVTLDDGTRIGRGDDVTGDGRPDIIAVANSGGAHCCATYHVFELAPDGLTQIAVIEAQHGGGFEDVNHDRIPEFVTPDWTWAYALTCYACLDYPEVVLQFSAAGYAAQPQLMKRPAPAESNAQFVERIRRIEQARAMDRRDRTWSEMLRRIYTGHAPLAWPLFEDAWEPEWGPKQALLGDFMDVLRSTPHLAALIELNGGDETLASGGRLAAGGP